MRLVAACVALFPVPAMAEAYHDLGKPEQCGTYAEAQYDRETWFPGGESGTISLTDAQSVRGLNAALYEGTVTDEGASDPAGRVLALRGPLATVEGATGEEVLVIMTENGVRVLKKCS